MLKQKPLLRIEHNGGTNPKNDIMANIDNNALFCRLTAMPRTDLHRVIIMCKWDALNKRYDKYGIDEEFKVLRKELKELIKRYPDVDLLELSRFKPNEKTLIDKKRGAYKTLHGYNFNYAPVSH